MPRAKRVGRPALPKGNAKAVMLRVRVTPDELKTFGTLQYPEYPSGPTERSLSSSDTVQPEYF